jgi:hypothetical protein
VSRTIAVPTVVLALDSAVALAACGSTATYGKVLLDRGGRVRGTRNNSDGARHRKSACPPGGAPAAEWAAG